MRRDAKLLRLPGVGTTKLQKDTVIDVHSCEPITGTVE
jgi:hypothetical protein